MVASPTAPLLESNNEGEKRNKGRILGKLIDLEEAKDRILFSVPIIVTNVAYYLITLVSIMFAGHLGELELAAGSTLANSCATVTSHVLMVVKEAMLRTIKGALGNQWSDAMCGAWTEVYDQLGEAIKIVKKAEALAEKNANEPA